MRVDAKDVPVDDESSSDDEGSLVWFPKPTSPDAYLQLPRPSGLKAPSVNTNLDVFDYNLSL